MLKNKTNKPEKNEAKGEKPCRQPPDKQPVCKNKKLKPREKQPIGVDNIIVDGPSEFGSWLQSERMKKGWTLATLANKSQVSLVQIWNIENGNSMNPQDRTRNKLIEAFGSGTIIKNNKLQQAIKKTEREATVDDVGEFTDFDPYDREDCPAEPGVYVFYDISQRPIYIGQSDNIRNRIIRDHIDKFWFRAPIVQTAVYIRIEESRLRKQIEKILIKLLRSNAVINKQHVEREESGKEDKPI